MKRGAEGIQQRPQYVQTIQSKTKTNNIYDQNWPNKWSYSIGIFSLDT